MSISASAQKLPRGNFSYATSLPATPDITVSEALFGLLRRRSQAQTTPIRETAVGRAAASEATLFAPAGPSSQGQARLRAHVTDEQPSNDA